MASEEPFGLGAMAGLPEPWARPRRHPPTTPSRGAQPWSVATSQAAGCLMHMG